MPESTISPTSAGEVTELLAAARRGDRGALDRLISLVYEELHAVARRQLRHWSPGQTIDTTGLVHEAYLRMVERTGAVWHDRKHFLSIAGMAMRHILVDAARRRAACKRGGADLRVTFAESRLGEGGLEMDAVDVLALDEALTSLAALDERLSRMVELRFFAGLTEEETAEALGTSDRTLRRDWRKARAFLFRELTRPKT